MKHVYPYAVHAFALSSVLSIVAILPAEAQQGGEQVANGANPQAVQAVIPSDSELAARVDDIVAEWLQKPGAVGLSVAVVRGNEFIVAMGYGMADLEFNAPADTDTMFRIGSVTKQYTAAAIMKLIEQGKISLDDPLTKFLPDYPMQGHTVTVKHLLNHTSGIKSYTSIDRVMNENHCKAVTHDEALAWFKDEPFDFEPGTKWAYNNSGYYLLGIIIETLTGKTYGQHMQETFFTPLELDRTRFDSNIAVIVNRAQGYSMDEDVIANDRALEPTVPFSAGSIIASAKDLIEWQQLLLAGNVVSADSYKQMTTPTILPSGTNTHYGFGLEMGDFEGHQRIEHGGGIFGFNSTLEYYPDDQLHIAVISNGERLSSKKLAREIVIAALGIDRAPVQDVAISEEAFTPFAGHFKFEMIPLEADFTWKDGKPHVQATEQPAFAILYQGGNEFRASFDTEVKIVFADDRQSFTLFQNGGQQVAKRVE